MHLGFRRERRRCAPGLVRLRREARLRAEWLESRHLLSTAGVGAAPAVTPLVNALAGPAAAVAQASPLPGSTTPQQILAAYGGTNLGDGSGQTIAIVEAYSDPNIASDVKTFDQQYSLPDFAASPAQGPTLNVVNQTGGTALPQADASWSAETALDVEWAHAIAPKANILLVDASSATLPDLMQAVDYARHQSGVSVVSMSWGAPEQLLDPSVQSQYDALFTTPTSADGSTQANGITFVASSGDDGGLLGASWPASSPNVLSVGGTTLPLAANGTPAGAETGWTLSGGGVSLNEPEPAYQAGVQATGARTTPDVAYDANPSTGFAVYSSVGTAPGSGWVQVGGTSAGAPQWAALVALADQSRAAQSLPSLDGASQTLPALYQAGPSAFHAIAGGSNAAGAAGSGYNLVTGLGSPVDSRIVASLASFGVTHPAGSASASPAVAAVNVTSQPFDQTSTTVVTIVQVGPSSGGQSAEGSRRVTPPGGSNSSGSTVVLIFLNGTGFGLFPPLIAPAPAPVHVQNVGLNAGVAQEAALAPVAQPLLSNTGNRLQARSGAESGLLDEAPADSPENSPPRIYDLPPGRDLGIDANPAIARGPLELWDRALDALVRERDRERAEPIPLIHDITPPPLPAESDPTDRTLGSSIVAGAAVAFWLRRRAKRDDDNRRRISLPN